MKFNLGFSLFSKAGATGHVFLLKGGKRHDKGPAFSGFLLPWTTVAVVPTVPQIVNFAIEALTKDNQKVMVRGSLTAALTPATAVSKFDFTVNKDSGAYTSQWQQALQAHIIERIIRPVLSKIKDLSVNDAIRSQAAVEEEVLRVVGNGTLATDGINVASCSVPKIESTDEEVRDAIGATEREQMLTTADAARHARQMKAAADERALRQYEEETKLELEKKKGETLVETNKNKQAEATGDAAATKTRLDALKEVEPGKVLGAALLQMAKEGVGNLVITNELLNALGGKPEEK